LFSRLRKKHLLYGFLVVPAFMIVFVGYHAYLTRSNPSLIKTFCLEHDCECVDWYLGSVGQYQVENNIWNRGNVKSYQQCVFITDGDHDINAGWAWNWPGIRFDVVAYPNLLFGKNPWRPSTSSQMPLRIDKISCLEAKFNVVQTGSGMNNLSFDLWLTDNLLSNPSSITHEIMIWLSSEGFWPAGSREETLEIDGNKIDLWKKENHNPSGDNEWTYLAFVYQSDYTEGTIKIHDFLGYLSEKGYIDPEAYLSGIQLGNEIVSGYGESYINNFEVIFCDK